MYRHTMLVATVVVCMQFTLAATGVTSVAGVRAAQATLTREKGGCSRANRSLQVEEAKAALPTHAFPDAGMDGPDGANVRIHRTSAVAVFRPSPLRSSPRPLCIEEALHLSLTLLLLSTTADFPPTIAHPQLRPLKGPHPGLQPGHLCHHPDGRRRSGALSGLYQRERRGR